MNNFLVLLAGGKGERLKEITGNVAKQFFVVQNQSFLQRTFDYYSCLTKLGVQIGVCANQQYQPLVSEHLQNQQYHFIGEPETSNTAMAIVHSVKWVQQNYEHFNLCFVPIDHVLSAPEQFTKIVWQIFSFLAQHRDNMIIFGSQLSNFQPQFGYIQTGKKFANNLFFVQNFLEKPQQNLQDTPDWTNWLVNRGVFMFSSIWAKKYLELIDPKTTASFDQIFLQKYPEKLLVCPTKLDWTDVGTLEAFKQIFC